MADIRAGDVAQLTINGREYDPAPDMSCKLIPGGISFEASITGNGALHPKGKRQRAGLTGVKVSINDERGDLEALVDVRNAGLTVPVMLTLISGKAYTGPLLLVGDDLGKDTGEGTAEFDLIGVKFEAV